MPPPAGALACTHCCLHTATWLPLGQPQQVACPCDRCWVVATVPAGPNARTCHVLSHVGHGNIHRQHHAAAHAGPHACGITPQHPCCTGTLLCICTPRGLSCDPCRLPNCGTHRGSAPPPPRLERFTAATLPAWLLVICWQRRLPLPPHPVTSHPTPPAPYTTILQRLCRPRPFPFPLANALLPAPQAPLPPSQARHATPSVQGTS